jgi:hypothetical protein
MRCSPFTILILAICLISSTAVRSSEIEAIITQKQAPAGVVFEIVSDEADLLGELLPSVRADITKLRQRFPGLPVAIVSHGSEQFALTSKNYSTEQRTHDLVESLVRSDKVDVHVCATHAGWYGVSVEAFPDYVDVTAVAPALIDDYEAIGYEIIILTE